MGTIFTDIAQLNVIKFCADEVQYQGDIPSLVYNMTRAWDTAYLQTELNPEFIKALGYLVKPSMNADWRTSNIFINYAPAGAPWQEIPRLINQLFYNIISKLSGQMTPIEIFQQFEDIHPFRDGNGRVGQIIYNWFNKTMLNPIRAEYKKS